MVDPHSDPHVAETSLTNSGPGGLVEWLVTPRWVDAEGRRRETADWPVTLLVTSRSA